jgi:methyltransferase family protein
MIDKVRKLLSRAMFKAALLVGPRIGTEREVIALDDEYLKWLGFANAGMQHPGNAYLFEYVIRNLPNAAPILEIGSFCGLSTNMLAYFKWKHGARNPVINCDRWQFEDEGDRYREGSIFKSFLAYKDYSAFVRDTYIRNVRMFSGQELPHTIEKTSDEFFAAWSAGESVEDVFGRRLTLGGPLSFCFIDGNHSYAYAKRDFLNCDCSLGNGGFLLFDDSAENSFGVHLLMPEVLATGRYKLIARNPNHLFQKLG